MGEILDTRRGETKDRFGQFQEALHIEEEITRKTCVYVTGSFGRGEASKYSDLDLFIVGLADENSSRLLSEPDEICLKAELIKTARTLGFPEFSGGAEYLIHYTDQELIQALGTRDDDAKNTFTARLLLLLESRSVVGPNVYDQTITNVVNTYWRDYDGRKKEFAPTFLANDILRLWRTFCVNYEANSASEPEEEKAKRKLKNYKLRHSRLLTCYSTLLSLLTIYVDQKTVHPADVIRMTQLTPTERLESLTTNKGLPAEARKTIQELLDQYEKFLEFTNQSKKALVGLFMDREKSKQQFRAAGSLGDLTFKALELIGRGNSFYRILVV